ncbi:DEAD/DEAH box helicase [Alicyclobacillus tolerans]|uniref:DEAD/DEAH box helicase n=1 Tax=Alicyclobacillus tolerans TaxID=90970 RepID=UPI001F354C72|nr:DEAD/DEAH box helicase [Alicyclobacillus tolerans]MCF8567027.1 DEAD/DEAH box helicase [Alicyclobacillus tolerans]
MEIQLRPYQKEAVDAFFNALPQHRRQLITLPTGSGKTVVFGSVAKRFYETVHSEKPILVLAHRTELLEQAEAKIYMVWPHVITGRVQAERNEQLAQVILASTQTLVAGRSIREPGLVIYDESHHARAEGALRVLEHLGVFKEDGPPLLGVTATPFRSDKTELGDIFEHLTYERTILQMIMDGYLTNVRGKKVDVPNLELKQVRTSAGDYNVQDLSLAMNHDIALNAVVEAVTVNAKHRKSIVFAVDVKHANALAQRFKLAGYKAAAIDGGMKAEERAKILADFAADKIRILVNCQILTEGFDQPDVDCVVIARPTKSQSLYTQMVRRALRLHPGKSEALILDLTGASDDKNLQTFARLMKTQTKRKPQKKSFASGAKVQDVEPENEAQSLMTEESVAEWLKRLAALEQQEQFVESINLFANRTRFRWERVQNHFAISYGDGHWAYLIVEGTNWWPVLELTGSRYLPLHDKALPLEYAQGIVEGYLELLESKVIQKDADWRTAPMSKAQATLLDKFQIAHDETWTRGMASDALNRRFANVQVRKAVAAFQPDKWRKVWETPETKRKYENMVAALRKSAQQHRRAQ